MPARRERRPGTTRRRGRRGRRPSRRRARGAAPRARRWRPCRRRPPSERPGGGSRPATSRSTDTVLSTAALSATPTTRPDRRIVDGPGHRARHPSAAASASSRVGCPSVPPGRARRQRAAGDPEPERACERRGPRATRPGTRRRTRRPRRSCRPHRRRSPRRARRAVRAHRERAVRAALDGDRSRPRAGAQRQRPGRRLDVVDARQRDGTPPRWGAARPPRRRPPRTRRPTPPPDPSWDRGSSSRRPSRAARNSAGTSAARPGCRK